MRARRAWTALGLLTGAVLVVAVLAAAQGDVDLASRGSGWAQVCSGRRPRPDREVLAPCARVRGRVVWLQRGRGEVHLAMLAGFHLFVAKLGADDPTPSVGAMRVVTGPLVRARNGLREIQAWQVQPG